MANLRIRMTPQFPANVRGSGGISVTKSSGRWEIGPRWSELPLIENTGDVPNQQIWTYDEANDTYARTKLPFVVSGSVRWDVDQNLSDEERAQALKNLGLFPAVNVKEFGAVGDGEADDQTAFAAAIAAARTSGSCLVVPPGEYLVDDFDYGMPTFGNQISIIGFDPKKTIIRKRTSDGAPLLKINSASATGYQALLSISGIAFEGIAGNTTAALIAYDLARVIFTNCYFSKAVRGVDLRGGVNVKFKDCYIHDNTVGVYIRKYTGYAGWPNLTELTSCVVTNNSSRGVDFDDGRFLNILNCDIEGNGTNGVNTDAAIWIGSSVGTEGGSVQVEPGAFIRGCWLEANAGQAAIVGAGGKTAIRDTYFVANTNATYDTYFSGGRYHLDNCIYGSNKTNNHFETSGVVAGSMIVGCTIRGGITVDADKTTQIDHGSIRTFVPASAVNFLQIRSAAASGQVILQPVGSDANIPIVVRSKGTEPILFQTNAGGNETMRCTHVTNSVNRFDVRGGTTGQPIQIIAAGTDTDVSINIRPKGAGQSRLTDSNANVRVAADSTGLGFFGTTPVAAPSGWGTATGTATRSTFVTSSVTLPQLAERVKALIDDLHQTAGFGLLRT